MIDLTHYDGQMHRVPFAVGADFIAKWNAYRADGFTVSLRDGHFLAYKVMPGEPLPSDGITYDQALDIHISRCDEPGFAFRVGERQEALLRTDRKLDLDEAFRLAVEAEVAA